MQLPEDAVDEIRNRLKRAAGQVLAVERMLADGRECREVAAQLAAANRALDQAGFRLLAAGMAYCIEHPIEAEQSGYSLEEVERMFSKAT